MSNPNAHRITGSNRIKRSCKSRRGVAAVLAMMFLVLFGSLSVAMAIASKGNITTAATHLHVMRAQGAAETGLSIAKSRLKEGAARFLISASDVTPSFGRSLWAGDVDSLGAVTVLPAPSGRQDAGRPDNLITALSQAHALIESVDTDLASPIVRTGAAPSNASDEYDNDDWLFTPAEIVEPGATQNDPASLAYSITYAPLADGVTIRAIVTGYDRGYSRDGTCITRTIMQDFKMVKRVNQAIISPTRVMIGKNVMVTGDLGARFDNVTALDGDPLIIRSDFRGLSTTLDSKLNAFYAALGSDIDGDNRLRAAHPTEGPVVPSATTDFDGNGTADDAFRDATEDGYVDEFDIFINHFDRNGDRKITLSAALTNGTPAQGMAPELVGNNGQSLDEDLGAMIDASNPDRNRNGIYGFNDTNRNGRWDSGEIMSDYDASNGTYSDQVLGFRDGFIDRKDQYAKVNGKLVFKTTQSEWTQAQGAVQPDRLQGPIVQGATPGIVQFGVDDSTLPEISSPLFATEQSGLQALADGPSFAAQVSTNLAVAESALPTYNETKPESSTLPRYRRVDPDLNNDSLPDNHTTAYFEKMPFNGPSYSDWYFRPVYDNMIFKNVVIPIGTNALFRNCTFVGVTYVRTTVQNSHVLWSEYGRLAWSSAAGRPVPWSPRYVYGDSATELSYPTQLPATAVPPNQMILMATPMLDQADLPASQQAGVVDFNLLPLPLVVNGRRITDTKSLSNNIRFHNCLFVGSVVSETPVRFTQARNKLQFTGSTRFASQHPDSPDSTTLNPDAADLDAIRKSSLMVPNYSVDIGTFNSPTTQNVSLQGAIIAGVLDVRGNADIDGTLLLTYKPEAGVAPLIDALGQPAGNPAAFNTTIGYFGPDDGDAESLDPSTLPVLNGVRIAGWDTNNDGIYDVPANLARPTNSFPVPFAGYGRVNLRFNPTMTLPDGILVPMQFDEISESYKEQSL